MINDIFTFLSRIAVSLADAYAEVLRADAALTLAQADTTQTATIIILSVFAGFSMLIAVVGATGKLCDWK